MLPATLDVSAVGEFNRNHETNANSSIFLLVKRLMDSIQCEVEMIQYDHLELLKINYSNSALKPLPRLPNVPKVAYVWDILIFQAFGTSRSTGKY